MDDGLRKRMTTLEHLWNEQQASRRGVRGLKVFRVLILGRDDRDGKLQSRLEAKILAILRSIEEETFEVQVPFVANGERYRLDFFHRRSVTGIEGHSFTHHFGKDTHNRTAKRHNNLTLSGIRMLYVTWDEASFKEDEVKESVQVAISSPRKQVGLGEGDSLDSVAEGGCG
jgi:hypothetical protein